MDLDASAKDSPEGELGAKSRRLRARKASSGTSPDAPLPKKKKVDQNENLSVEEIYKQLSSVKAKCTSLETIYEFPKTSKDPAKSFMSSVKSKRACVLSNFYNPAKSKVKARKERAKRLQKRGVKVPTGSGVTLEQLQAALGAISDDEEEDFLPNSSVMLNLTINTGGNSQAKNKVVLRPDIERHDVSLVEGPYILPDLSYQEDTPAPPPMTEEELFEKTKHIFEDISDECVKPARRKGRRSGCGRDFLPTLNLSRQSIQEVTSSVSATNEKFHNEKEEPKSQPCGERLANVNERIKTDLSTPKSIDLISTNFGEKLAATQFSSHSQSVPYNLNSEVGDTSKILDGLKICPQEKEKVKSINSCLSDTSKRRCKRRISGVEKALYSSHITYSPTPITESTDESSHITYSPTPITESTDEENSSVKLDESSSDSLRAGFETKLDLNTSVIEGDFDGSTERVTLKRKPDSDFLSPLAARLQGLAVKDACGDLTRCNPNAEATSATGGGSDSSTDVPSRKIIHGRRRSMRLSTATLKFNASCDTNQIDAQLREKPDFHSHNEAFVNSVIVQEDQSVTGPHGTAISELSTLECEAAIINSKTKKLGGKCSVGKKSSSINKLSKFEPQENQGCDSIQNPIIDFSAQSSPNPTSDIQNLRAKHNSKALYEESLMENSGNVDCYQKPKLSTSDKNLDLISEREFSETLRANSTKGSAHGSKLLAKLKSQQNVSCLSADLNALSVSSKDDKAQAEPSDLASSVVRLTKDCQSPNNEQTSTTFFSSEGEGGLEEKFTAESRTNVGLIENHAPKNTAPNSLHLSPKEKESTSIANSISGYSEAKLKKKNCSESNKRTPFCAVLSDTEDMKESEVNSVVTEQSPPKQGVKRSSVSGDTFSAGFKSSESNEKRIHGGMKNRSSSNNSRPLTRSVLRGSKVSLAQSPMKQTKKPKILKETFDIKKGSNFGMSAQSKRSLNPLTSSEGLPVSKPDLDHPAGAKETPVLDGIFLTDGALVPKGISPSAVSLSPHSQNADTNSQKEALLTGSEKQTQATTIENSKTLTFPPAAQAPATPCNMPLSNASSSCPRKLPAFNADSPLLSAMFNNAVGVRVGKVFSNNKLHKSEKMSTRKIVDKFKVYQS